MKKILVLVFLSLCLIACDNEKTKEENKNGIVISYTSYSNYGTDEDLKNYYNISLYHDKTITYGYKNDKLKKKRITQKEYDKIVGYAFSDKILKLDKDISDNDILDGASSYLVLYLENGTKFKTGGANPSNKNYKKLISMLYSYID